MVRWKGYPPSDDSWVSKADLVLCDGEMKARLAHCEAKAKESADGTWLDLEPPKLTTSTDSDGAAASDGGGGDENDDLRPKPEPAAVTPSDAQPPSASLHEPSPKRHRPAAGADDGSRVLAAAAVLQPAQPLQGACSAFSALPPRPTLPAQTVLSVQPAMPLAFGSMGNPQAIARPLPASDQPLPQAATLHAQDFKLTHRVPRGEAPALQLSLPQPAHLRPPAQLSPVVAWANSQVAAAMATGRVAAAVPVPTPAAMQVAPTPAAPTPAVESLLSLARMAHEAQP